jgi:hypothetical protein
MKPSLGEYMFFNETVGDILGRGQRRMQIRV